MTDLYNETFHVDVVTPDAQDEYRDLRYLVMVHGETADIRRAAENHMLSYFLHYWVRRAL